MGTLLQNFLSGFLREPFVMQASARLISWRITLCAIGVSFEHASLGIIGTDPTTIFHCRIRGDDSCKCLVGLLQVPIQMYNAAYVIKGYTPQPGDYEFGCTIANGRYQGKPSVGVPSPFCTAPPSAPRTATLCRLEQVRAGIQVAD